MSHNELIRRAIRAYMARCRREGGLEMQPSSASYFDPNSNTVTLHNVNGVLAVYRWDPATNRLHYVHQETVCA
jgi:hypothetical protein